MRMKYVIKYEKNALKYLMRLDRTTQLRIINAINDLPEGDVKKLQGSVNEYRLRIGDFRVIFSKNAKVLLISVVQIASRGEVYKK